MSQPRKTWGVLLLAAASLGGLSRQPQARRLCASAQHFVGYYRALEKTDRQAGFWDRVTLSLVLTGTDPGASQCP